MSDIILKDVTYSYSGGVAALVGLNAKLGPGIHLLMGPNGAGKTTLLQVMAGILVPERGECLIDNDCIGQRRPADLQRVFYLAEDCKFPLNTINEMVDRHAPFYPNFSELMLKENLAAFGMNGTERLDRMSLGERKKANIAYALALGVDVLLLDEPANGLDILSKKTLNRMIAQSMTDSNIILIATHTVLEMNKLFDSITFIANGHITLSVPTYAILQRLAFIISPQPMANAIYSEQDVNGYHAILVNDGGLETEIDYILLYMAMVSDKGVYISNLINAETR